MDLILGLKPKDLILDMFLTQKRANVNRYVHRPAQSAISIKLICSNSLLMVSRLKDGFLRSFMALRVRKKDTGNQMRLTILPTAFAGRWWRSMLRSNARR